jgi:hypothetical protein
MGPLERNRHVEAEKNRLTAKLEKHIRTLETLASTTTFNFDVATDIHPSLLDTHPEGMKKLQFYTGLYAAIEKGDRFVSLTRVFTDRNPHESDRKGSETIVTAHVHLFENLTQEQVHFHKGNDADSSISIDAPNVYFAYDFRSGMTISDESSMALFAEQEPAFSFGDENPFALPELILGQPLIATGDTERVAHAGLRTLPMYERAFGLSRTMLSWAADKIHGTTAS